MILTEPVDRHSTVDVVIYVRLKGNAVSKAISLEDIVSFISGHYNVESVDWEGVA